MAEPHRLAVRVYYEDTDAGGIVYHARYLHYCERARTEMLRDAGFDHMSLMRDHGLAFTVVDMDMAFRRPARLDDLLSVETVVEAVRPASIRLSQRVLKDSDLLYRTGVRLALVAISGDTPSPKRLPKAIFEGFSQLLPCS
ncbi:MAG: tol-pal system-associated acyl-CoA thioesterase [Alphaproteobacteria bacterium]|nr:tol-pal system-associated acyl-CoA thioesterase [Alphaproteobacteria bacterium]